MFGLFSIFGIIHEIKDKTPQEWAITFNTGSWREMPLQYGTTEAGIAPADNAYPGTGHEHLWSYSIQLKTTPCPNLLHSVF